jgi:predicted GIY-YIG superfamily endonuclease
VTTWTVYRVYDDADRLIYVGCTYDLDKRIRAHRGGSWWRSQIARVVAVAQYPARREALAAERHAIETEAPRWNRMFRWALRDTFTEQQWLDYITAWERGGWPIDYTRAHLAAARAEFAARFPSGVAA